MGSLLTGLRAVSATVLCAVLLLLVGCGDASVTLVPAQGTSSAPPPFPLPVPPSTATRALVGFSDGIAVLDLDARRILSRSPRGPLWGPRDMAFDTDGSRVLLVESDVDLGLSELSSVSFLPPSSFGFRTPWGSIDGEARVVPTAFGVVLFERGYDTRAQLLEASPGAAEGRAVEPPMSLELAPSGAGLSFRMLTRAPPAGRAHLVEMPLDADGLGLPTSVELEGGGAVGPSARLAGPWLADVSRGTLVLRAVSGHHLGPPRSLELKTSRVEHFVSLDDGAWALLLADPSAVAVVSLDEAGAPFVAGVVPLPGQVAAADVFFSRDLIVLGRESLLAATDAGVFEITLVDGEPALEQGFAGLSGPLAALDP